MYSSPAPSRGSMRGGQDQNEGGMPTGMYLSPAPSRGSMRGGRTVRLTRDGWAWFVAQPQLM